MSYKLKISLPDGEFFEVECSTAEEVLALKYAQSSKNQANTSNGQVRKNEPAKQPKSAKAINEVASSDREIALKLLGAIQHAGPQGASSDALMKAVDVKKSHLLGGRMIRAIGVFKAVGYEPEDLFDMVTVYSGGQRKFFRKAKPKIADAIAKLREEN
jgi:hypothetical protein